jgi:hypothetical protein
MSTPPTGCHANSLNHRVQLVDGIDAANFGGLMQRIHDDPTLVPLDGDEVLPPVRRELANANLATPLRTNISGSP